MSAEPSRVDFDSAGGVKVAAYRWDPPGPARGIVQLTHGMGEHALRYGAVAQSLNAQGFVVYAQDHRGHGATAGSLDQQGLIGADGWTELVNDIGRLRLVALAEQDRGQGALPVVLVGHSMGSFAVQQYLPEHSGDVAAVVLTGTAAIDLMEPGLDLTGPLDLSAFNAPFVPARTDYDWLSRDEAQVDAYVADPRCGFGLDQEGTRQMFAAARRLADPQVLGAIRKDLPIYVAVGEHDPVNGQLALVNALIDRYRAAGIDDVTLRVYPGARHEVFNETNRDEVLADLEDWLRAAVFA
jgi:alpha-beta hydrolase superfamily lysophospholipase